MITAPCDAFSEFILIGAFPHAFCEDHVAIGIEASPNWVQTIIAHAPQKQCLKDGASRKPLSHNGYGHIYLDRICQPGLQPSR